MRKILPGILLLAAIASPVHADHQEHDSALLMRQQGTIVPSQQLLDQAFAIYPDGRLLEMALRPKKNRYIYKMLLLTRNGEVRKLYFDAQSGEQLQRPDKRAKQ